MYVAYISCEHTKQKDSKYAPMLQLEISVFAQFEEGRSSPEGGVPIARLRGQGTFLDVRQVQDLAIF